MMKLLNIPMGLKILSYLIFIVMTMGCSKLIEISPPINSITTDQTFADSLNASAAINGTYSQLYYSGSFASKLSSGFLTEFAALYTDELETFAHDFNYPYFRNNVTPNTNGTAYSLWSDPYSMLYQVNACIEGVTKSEGLSARLKSQFLGELKFQRAFLYFYLIHLFGDVPYITSIAYKETMNIGRTPVAEINIAIEQDLREAFDKLPPDYSTSNGEKVRINKWCVSALLARVYIYQGKWHEAEIEATKVIEQSALYSICDNLRDVFKPGNPEAILQFHQNTSIVPYNTTFEGFRMNVMKGAPPKVFLTGTLLHSFSSGDLRKLSWIDSTVYLGRVYYYPFKYKVGVNELMPGASASEYYTVLRLGEQYLIRAEARAELGKINQSLQDLNVMRKRAAINEYLSSSKEDILNEIQDERRREFFAEWGHRFFDLKRTGKIDDILKLTKPEWKPYKKLLPIPRTEMQKNSNLTQNPFY